MTERQSWSIREEHLAAELIELIGLTDLEAHMLATLEPEARAEAEALSDAFYARLLAHPPTQEYLEGPIGRLHRTLQDWFVALFSGRYDQEYARSRAAIGEVHVRIGLPIRYPLAMLDLVSWHGERVARHGGEGAVIAFRKVLALDVAIFNQAYENAQLRHLSELTGSELLARRLLAGKG
ncbi:hypothetical protein HNR42_002601 [Deinobacterium chartae]|uniref:Globin-sensor domain-containing protein n=1 Tax=Deinobacterium chartae TaxID=521158 RepID=A0A841I5L7_9DEIO|nr:protoglobin domain-containing protein [Deinobacterium chartae]MBB6099165.1 hypothetical protein [Deinobacterium chartae]